MKKRWIAVLMAAVLGLNLTACVPVEEIQEKPETEKTTEAPESGSSLETEDNYLFEDNDALYEEDDDTSVVTMYLTVSEGNESENTDHTWTEINSHSVYYYEKKGIERYKANALLQVGDENGPVEGELGYEKYTPNATVNVRGQTSSRRSQKNYKIELKDGMGTWNDQRVINLNKHQGDGTRFMNKLCFDLLEELPGTVSLQTQFVHLYVKDETEGGSGQFEDYGLYTQVEQPNKSFLKRHGFDKNGQLYKINFFEFYRYEDVIMLKSDADYDQTAFEERIEIKGDDDHSKLIAMLEDLNDDVKPIDEVLNKWFDIDNLTSWLTFHILVGNIDTQSRNTLLYSPLNGTKWYFISWDNDGSFERTQAKVKEDSLEIGWEHGISNYWGNILFQRALRSEKFRTALDEKMKEYLSILTEEKLSEMIEGYKKVVKPYAYGNVDRYYEPLTSAEYDEMCKQLPEEISTNYKLYKESLTEPMPFYIGAPEVDGNTVKFTWDNSYDFQNENIFYTFELSDNLEFKNPIVTENEIFVPGYTYEGKLKPGQYFIRSLYFDDHWENAYEEKLSGTSERKKYRIRIYNLEDNLIRLECKRKEGQYINKISAKLSREETDRMLRGDYGFLRYRDEPVCRDFYLENAMNQMKPKVVVDYDRIPFVYPYGDVRITFDCHVRAGVFENSIFDEKLPVMEVLEPGQLILEVKFTEYLPGLIQSLLQVNDSIYTAASKYVLCLEKRKEFLGEQV